MHVGGSQIRGAAGEALALARGTAHETDGRADLPAVVAALPGLSPRSTAALTAAANEAAALLHADQVAALTARAGAIDAARATILPHAAQPVSGLGDDVPVGIPVLDPRIPEQQHHRLLARHAPMLDLASGRLAFDPFDPGRAVAVHRDVARMLGHAVGRLEPLGAAPAAARGEAAEQVLDVVPMAQLGPAGGFEDAMSASTWARAALRFGAMPDDSTHAIALLRVTDAAGRPRFVPAAASIGASTGPESVAGVQGWAMPDVQVGSESPLAGVLLGARGEWHPARSVVGPQGHSNGVLSLEHANPRSIEHYPADRIDAIQHAERTLAARAVQVDVLQTVLGARGIDGTKAARAGVEELAADLRQVEQQLAPLRTSGTSSTPRWARPTRSIAVNDPEYRRALPLFEDYLATERWGKFGYLLADSSYSGSYRTGHQHVVAALADGMSETEAAARLRFAGEMADAERLSQFDRPMKDGRVAQAAMASDRTLEQLQARLAVTTAASSDRLVTQVAEAVDSDIPLDDLARLAQALPADDKSWQLARHTWRSPLPASARIQVIERLEREGLARYDDRSGLGAAFSAATPAAANDVVELQERLGVFAAWRHREAVNTTSYAGQDYHKVMRIRGAASDAAASATARSASLVELVASGKRAGETARIVELVETVAGTGALAKEGATGDRARGLLKRAYQSSFSLEQLGRMTAEADGKWTTGGKLRHLEQGLDTTAG